MIGASLKTILASVIKIYPLQASQGKVLPLATYQVTSDVPEKNMNGRGTLRRMSVQININAATYDQAETLSRSVISTLDQYTGTSASEIIKKIRCQNGPDDLYQEDAEVYGKAIDFTIYVEQ
ncbi:MAG: minor capsid protein [Bacteroidota bacterium]|nr:minor capsid protein [Bacteroidota bacterium]